MQIMPEFQKRHDRELMLDRKELAAILLSGEGENRQEVNDLASRAGLQRLPDRVMAIQLRHAAREGDPPTRISSRASLSRLSHAAEDISQNWPNALAIVVRPGELCVFCSLEVRNPNHERISLPVRLVDSWSRDAAFFIIAQPDHCSCDRREGRR
jgi:hypothetical protein